MGTLNKVMWHCLCLFPMLKLTSVIFPFYHHYMKPTSATQHSTVISLFKEYAVHKIKSKTSLGRSNVGRIKKKTDLDKENSKGGHPSKLFPLVIHSQLSIKLPLEGLIMLFKLVILSMTSFPLLLLPKQWEMHSRKGTFASVFKQKWPLLKQAYQQNHLNFAQKHENWTVKDWKRVLWSDETKINRIGSDGSVYTWRK